ncbi:GNAT family N-acetyltransferase [Streptomyces sp. NPDC001922]|uniref:GNAT family N-acetyltransferase n=1 Tax=Streptomyces sp. NPDC001922 TaxID=3364624 RepID=UPI0036D0A36C
MNTELRQAAPGDYDRIVTVMDEWWGRPIRSGLPRLFLDHFFRTSLVAEDGGRPGALAGFLVGFLSDADRETAYIHFVGVAPGHRGGGLARRLYARFFELARADGRSVVRSVTSPRNTASIAFHTALGFTVTGPFTDYDGPSEDRMCFRRGLDAFPSGPAEAAHGTAAADGAPARRGQHGD